MEPNKELRKQASRTLDRSRGRWLTISAVSLALGGVSLLAFSALQISLLLIANGLRSGLFDPVAGLMKYTYLILALHLVLSVFVGSVVELGLDRIILLRLRGEDAEPGTLFYYRSVNWEAVLLRLFMSVRVTLWSLLLVIPGIAAILNYAMAPFLLAQNPRMGAPQAIRVSKYLMRGYKKKLLGLFLSYAGELLLSLLLLGVPLFWVMPRIKCAVAVFFRERVRLHDEELQQMQEQREEE